MLAPDAYIRWINHHLGFNPRSQAASNALADFILEDLTRDCPSLRRALRSGVLVARKSAPVRTTVAERDVDLVLCEETHELPRLRLAVENKTIMAAHGKARKNRYGDIIAYANHVHNHRADCIAGSVLVINHSSEYENPDAFAKGLKRPRLDMDRLVSDTVQLFANIPLRDTTGQSFELPEALAVIVLEYDGVRPAKLLKKPPAPRASEHYHYAAFMRRLCELHGKRFGGRG